MVDKQDKDKQDTSKEEEDDEEDYSITTTSKTKVPEINLFGIKVKLDTLTLVAAALGTAAAGGVGYLLYDQYNKNKLVEDQRKAYENQERQRQQAIFNQYVNDSQPVANKPIKRKREVPVVDVENNLVDMDNYPEPTPEPEPPNFDRILGHGHSYQSVPAPKLASKYNVANSASHATEEAVVDMDQYEEEPEMAITPTVAAPKRKNMEEQQQEPTEEELFAQMNNNNFY